MPHRDSRVGREHGLWNSEVSEAALTFRLFWGLGRSNNQTNLIFPAAGDYPNAVLEIGMARDDAGELVTEALSIPIHLVVNG